ncbi:MAG: 23S rRNA (uracil(1939)-C(5))-methyltransferase RlmD [Traorella sp.]
MKVEIKKSGINGEGIGYINKQPVFIPLTLPEETCEVTIVEKHKTYSIGKAEKIEKKSKNRCTPACQEFKQCKTCSMMISNYPYQCELKLENLKQTLYKYAKIPSKQIQPIIKSNDIYGYRNSCKVPFGMKNDELVTGMFQPNSNYFTSIETCIIHDPEIEKIRKEVLRILNEAQYKNYDPKTKMGMRTLVIRKIDENAQITLVTGKTEISQECIDKILQIPHVISLWQSIHIQKGVDIFGEKMICLSDKRFLDFNLKGVPIKLSPRSFFQLNTKQANILYDIIKENVGKVNLLVEAYSGIGGISFTLRDQAKEIIGIENIKDAVINANMCAKENHLDHIHFICDDASYKLQYISKKREIDCLVVDPPRTGLDELMIDTILRSKIKKVIYVSCNPATLGKNLAILQNKYQVQKVIPVDMFPQTQHVESVVVMTRKGNK